MDNVRSHGFGWAAAIGHSIAWPNIRLFLSKCVRRCAGGGKRASLSDNVHMGDHNRRVVLWIARQFVFTLVTNQLVSCQ